jgi:hypothetical protein
MAVHGSLKPFAFEVGYLVMVYLTGSEGSVDGEARFGGIHPAHA